MRIARIEPNTDAIFKRIYTQCKHSKTTVRKKIQSNGAVSIWQQCIKCGHLVGPAIRKATHTPQQIELLQVWDEEIGRKYNKDRSDRHQIACDQERERVAKEWKRQYEAYLQTAEWRNRRNLVMLRAQG